MAPLGTSLAAVVHGLLLDVGLGLICRDDCHVDGEELRLRLVLDLGDVDLLVSVGHLIVVHLLELFFSVGLDFEQRILRVWHVGVLQKMNVAIDQAVDVVLDLDGPRVVDFVQLVDLRVEGATVGIRRVVRAAPVEHWSVDLVRVDLVHEVAILDEATTGNGRLQVTVRLHLQLLVGLRHILVLQILLRVSLLLLVDPLHLVDELALVVVLGLAILTAGLVEVVLFVDDAKAECASFLFAGHGPDGVALLG